MKNEEYIDELNKKLEYALLTGGEYLSSSEIKKIVN